MEEEIKTEYASGLGNCFAKGLLKCSVCGWISEVQCLHPPYSPAPPPPPTPLYRNTYFVTIFIIYRPIFCPEIFKTVF